MNPKVGFTATRTRIEAVTNGDAPAMDAASSQLRLERLGLIGLPVLAAVYVALLAMVNWPWIAHEHTPMTWLQSVMLVTCAVVAALLAATTRLRGGSGLKWALLATGFAYLALDERFMLHERIRDDLLAPHGIALPFLPWVDPGDFVLLGYGVVALAMLPLVLRIFHGRSRRLLLAGAALAVIAVLVDSFEVESLGVGVAEELMELASSTCCLLAMWLRLVPTLVPLPDTPAVETPAVGTPAVESPAVDLPRARVDDGVGKSRAESTAEEVDL